MSTTAYKSDPSCAKVLMLHAQGLTNNPGHGQSGQFFRCKTRFLQRKAEQIVLNAVQQDPSQSQVEVVEFHYPCAKLPVNPDQPEGEENHAWAWGYGDIDEDRIRGLEKSVTNIMRYIDKYGPFIGVMGFSTGATVATIVTSLLEKRESLCNFEFKTNHPPLEFAVSICGFTLANPFYKPVYSCIKTPFFHVIGTLDTMIHEYQCARLQECCENSYTHYFKGTHYVPRSEEFLDALCRFFEEVLTVKGDKSRELQGGQEEAWEDCEDCEAGVLL
ncbi:uncharacterized protein N7511_003085 [Penicillium nucicola]|uniref:uncharacterized protein n=1 Tax=Penicillium nucicola TaxID=1850975 RepID=UPI0025450220|nr:uncharacterized protein N7511_003085 [Penicillium nucicola]KAJ5771034.1 hypothetical protein N7511_003085 [Penicillium nucicola]